MTKYGAMGIFALLGVLYVAAGGLYSGGEIRGRVEDAETGTPLEGAVVVALWQLSPTAGLVHEPYHKRLKVLETTSDENGGFTLSGWGPTVLPPATKVDDTNPRLGAFKPGWRPVWLRGSKKIAEADGVLRLTEFKDTLEERAREAKFFYSTLHQGSGTDAIEDWQNYPMTTAVMLKELEFLKGQGLKPGRGPVVPLPEQLPAEERKRLEGYMR